MISYLVLLIPFLGNNCHTSLINYEIGNKKSNLEKMVIKKMKKMIVSIIVICFLLNTMTVVIAENQVSQETKNESNNNRIYG